MTLLFYLKVHNLCDRKACSFCLNGDNIKHFETMKPRRLNGDSAIMMVHLSLYVNDVLYMLKHGTLSRSHSFKEGFLAHYKFNYENLMTIFITLRVGNLL